MRDEGYTMPFTTKGTRYDVNSNSVTEIRADERIPHKVCEEFLQDREFESECFKYGKAWLNRSFMMVVCVVAIDQQLSDNMSEAEIRMAVLGNVLRDNMSRDCRSKTTSAFEMAEEDSAES